jgi:hypothetical protein
VGQSVADQLEAPVISQGFSRGNRGAVLFLSASRSQSRLGIANARGASAYRGSYSLNEPTQLARNSASLIGPHSFLIRYVRKLLLLATR